VCPMRHAAVLVEVDGEHKVVPLDDEVGIFLSFKYNLMRCFKC